MQNIIMDANSSSYIQIQNVNFSYPKATILKDISLTLTPGTCTGILGANGCGKSTFLSILAGVRRAQSGTITYQGASYSLTSKKRPLEFGYIPQDNPFLEQLTGYDNLYLWFKGNKAEFQAALDSPLIQMLGIGSYLRKEVKQYSGGMKRRLSLAAGFINAPSLLILDEPSAALDIPCKWDIYQYLTSFLKQGGTILLTTHEPAELDLCQHLYVLKSGLLSAVDSNLRGGDLISHF